jgi:hypothetical protein
MVDRELLPPAKKHPHRSRPESSMTSAASITGAVAGAVSFLGRRRGISAPPFDLRPFRDRRSAIGSPRYPGVESRCRPAVLRAVSRARSGGGQNQTGAERNTAVLVGEISGPEKRGQISVARLAGVPAQLARMRVVQAAKGIVKAVALDPPFGVPPPGRVHFQGARVRDMPLCREFGECARHDSNVRPLPPQGTPRETKPDDTRLARPLSSTSFGRVGTYSTHRSMGPVADV